MEKTDGLTELAPNSDWWPSTYEQRALAAVKRKPFFVSDAEIDRIVAELGECPLNRRGPQDRRQR